MRVREAIETARSLGVDRLDAQLLLAHRLGRSRSWLLAHDDELLPAADEAAYREMLAQRADDVPLAYLTGEREFHGLSFTVTHEVLVPRPETEGLVDWALELLREGANARVADLGTGSGAIAVALAGARPGLRIVATDCSAAALAVAAENARRHGCEVDFRRGSWWAPLAGECFDLVVSNPPYVAAGDPHLAALVHEPQAALVAGQDGLDSLRAIVAGATEHLNAGGWLLLEHGHDQGAAVRTLLAGAGFDAVATRSDLAGLPRCTGGRRPLS